MIKQNKMKIIQLLLYLFIIEVDCESNTEENTKSKKFVPYFRRQVEEIEENNVPEISAKDDPHSNFVSFLVNNVKEIFDYDIDKPENRLTKSIGTEATDKIDSTIVSALPSHTHNPTTDLFRPTIIDTKITVPSDTYPTIRPTRTDVIMYENLTFGVSPLNTPTIAGIYGNYSVTSSKNNVPGQGTRYNKKERDINIMARAFPNSLLPVNFSDIDEEQDPRRSCIICNNVALEDCNEPKNKLIRSVMCDREEDMCYTMHTPFGIIDRGCFNANHNLTTYVCSCNLCNYISISEMPYVFNNKQDWANNVIDISRSRHLRKSIFKDMSCLKCEVNATQGNIIDGANCLEGHIGKIPVTQCDNNEICGVKARRAEGYIWRGCIKVPLYNYWWSLCDYDLCNVESPFSLYDFV